jgi:GntR family transcriptional regulator, transcriptional repressor for pyruvate dehydrogenase complex
MFTPTPVTTRRTFEEALEQIVEAIRAGDLRAGDRIDSERTLAAQMQISRPTLREAIRVLADAGVIEVRPGAGGGMVVRSETIPRGLVERGSALRLNEVAGVLEARRLLEPRVAQLAGLYATEEDYDALQRTIDLQRECGHDRDRALLLDHRFHLAIARATRNTTIVSMMRLLLQRLEIARDMTPRAPHDPELEVSIHEQTLHAIVSGDPERIEAAMDEHLGYLERIWEEETGRVRLRRVPAFLQSGASARGR